MDRTQPDWMDELGADATSDQIGEWLAKKYLSSEPMTETEVAQAVRFAERHGWLTQRAPRPAAGEREG